MTPSASSTGLTAEQALTRYRETRDPRDLAALFDLASGDLFRVALHLCPDAATAEDALQETFLAVMEHPDRYEPGRPARPWLNAILRHQASHVRRREKRAPDPDRLPRPAAPADPALEAATAEEFERLREAMQRLPEPYRGVALLRWRYGLEPAEIADVRGVPPGTVASLLHRAVRRLRAEMGVVPALLLAFRSARGLEGVKSALVRRAAADAAIRSAAVGAGVGAAAVTGGIVMAGKTVAVGTAVLLAGAVAWFALSPSGASSPAAAPPPASSTPPPPSASPPPGQDGAADPEASTRPAGGGGAPESTATVTVRTTLRGAAPPMRPIKFDQDECCKAMHTTPMLEETVVARDGHLANVIVYVSKGAERHPRGVPAEPVLLDQTGCMYSPHVFTVTVGQRVLVRNSDRTTHNVHVAPKVNDDWNKSQLIGATDLTHSFDTPELPVRIKCDIHGWMLSWAGVFDHPFHAVTGEDGTATLRLPPGDYEISAWHEYPKFAGPAPQKVTVAGNEPREIEFVFEPK